MPKRSIREVGETIALIGVVASLVFVGLELRQSRIAAQAAAYQELGIAISNIWMERTNNRELNELVRIANGPDSAAWAELSESDVYLLRSLIVANVRLFETVFLQVEQGLLEKDAMDRLGWASLLNSTILERMWPHVRQAVTPSFATYLEDVQPRLRGL